VQLLRSGTVNFEDGTITLPLYKGYVGGRGGRRGGGQKTVWYILTETSDQNAAASLGLNFSQKLQFSAVGARTGSLDANGAIIFDRGEVDFRPEVSSQVRVRLLFRQSARSRAPSAIGTTARW
jgi:hypothetical protein